MSILVLFLYCFRIFGARPGVGDFVFFRISGLEGVLSSMPETRNRKDSFAKPLMGGPIAFPEIGSEKDTYHDQARLNRGEANKGQLHVSNERRTVLAEG